MCETLKMPKQLTFFKNFPPSSHPIPHTKPILGLWRLKFLDGKWERCLTMNTTCTFEVWEDAKQADERFAPQVILLPEWSLSGTLASVPDRDHSGSKMTWGAKRSSACLASSQTSNVQVVFMVKHLSHFPSKNFNLHNPNIGLVWGIGWEEGGKFLKKVSCFGIFKVSHTTTLYL